MQVTSISSDNRRYPRSLTHSVVSKILMDSAKHKVVREVHARVCGGIGATVSDAEAVTVSLASSVVRDCEELLGVLLNGIHAKRALAAVERITIQDSEWETLFGKDCVPSNDGGMAEIAACSEFSKLSDALEAAVRCSLVEQQSRNAWSRPIARLGCYVALHTEAAEDRVSRCLGGLVRADSRRLDDVRSGIEDEGTNHMLLSRILIAMGKAVC